MKDPAIVMLSVRAPHVDRLLDGTKTVELRRTRWRVAPGTTALLYASGSHRRELVGSMVITETVVDAPDVIWRTHGSASRVSREEFAQYFSGTAHAVAIRVDRVKSLPTPIALEELRNRYPRFAPPQSFRYVDPTELSSILNGERRHLL